MQWAKYMLRVLSQGCTVWTRRRMDASDSHLTVLQVTEMTINDYSDDNDDS